MSRFVASHNRPGSVNVAPDPTASQSSRTVLLNGGDRISLAAGSPLDRKEERPPEEFSLSRDSAALILRDFPALPSGSCP